MPALSPARTQPMDGGVTKVVLEVSRDTLKSPRQEEMLTICTDDPSCRQLQVPITLVP